MKELETSSMSDSKSPKPKTLTKARKGQCLRQASEEEQAEEAGAATAIVADNEGGRGVCILLVRLRDSQSLALPRRIISAAR